MVEEGTKGTCFVMMPFDDPFDRYSKVFEKAVEDAGLEPIRADSIFRPGFIMNDIWEGIRTSEILLAELTGRNTNVFYELGLAHAAGRPVVLVTQEIDDVPFDLQGLRLLKYELHEPGWGVKLKGEITRALEEALQDPISCIPPAFTDTSAPDRPVEDAVINELRELSGRVASLERTTMKTEFADYPEMAFTNAVRYASNLLRHEMSERSIIARIRSRYGVLPPDAVDEVMEQARNMVARHRE